MNLRTKAATLAFVALPLSLSLSFAGELSAWPGEFSGELSAEATVFSSPALYEGQEEFYGSVAAQPEYRLDWDAGRQNLNVVLFGRLDGHDRERSHGDVRELEWTLARDAWEFSAGISRVFWGVTESYHLVDIINQIDLVESADGDDRLGQPMARLALIPPFGTLHVYALPYFRERTFPGVKGRLRGPLPVARDAVEYESRDAQRHIDGAVRWEHGFGYLDYGLAYFAGTAREPVLFAGVDEQGRPFLIPVYQLIRRGSVDAQLTVDGWLLKLEAIDEERENAPAENFFATVAGFEYTLGGVFDSRIDVGLLAEYLYDERGEEAPQPFDDDVFAGVRIALNNEADTSLLAGAIVDRHRKTSFILIEGEHRLSASWKISLEAQIVDKPPEADAFFYAIRNDDAFRMQLSYFF